MPPRALRLTLLVALFASASGGRVARAEADPLAAAIAALAERIRSPAPADDETREIRAGAAPLLDQAAQALAQGKRWLALARLALVWSNVAAADYRGGIAGELRGQMAELERRWRLLGPELGVIDQAATAKRFERLPAAARALGEAALAQVPVYYEASLDYGRNTAPDEGLFYLGAALAQRDLAERIAGLESRPADQSELAPRDLSRDISTTRGELLAAYAPPLSIDHHAVFIRISALLKEADELAAVGAHYGALHRLLDARMRLSRLRHPGRSMTSEEAERVGREISAALTARGTDTSLERLFLETALFSAADPDPAAGGGEVAAAIFADVLPAFPALLGRAPPRPPEREAEATVTLVRWPYT